MPAHPSSPAPTAPACAIVLVCWNNKAYLEPCLESLYGSHMRHGFEVAVVDNGSVDGSQAMLREKYPDVRIIQNAGNVGLGKASNQGIEATSAPYILLLNNDTIVNGPSLEALIDFMAATPDAGAAGGTLWHEDGTFQAAWNHFPTLVEEFLIASRLGVLLRKEYPTVEGGTTPRAVDWIGSACLLVRRSALARVGLLDEHYFIYGDETDLQYRLAKDGWKVYHVPAATTIHFGGRSMDRWRRRKMVYRGKMLFFQKHYGALRTAALRALLGTLTLAKLVVWTLAWPLPGWQERSKREIASNADVLRLCLRLE
jgi:hypothetical protein